VVVDENVHSIVLQRLRDSGIEVEAIAESSPGISDAEILARDGLADCVLVTYDSDFGELIFKRDMPTPHALIYSRLGRAEPRYVADRILALLEKGFEAGHCYVILKDGVRVRPFSAGSMIDG
jgi:predicted nuclease of predicted toxin-antitoxin system